MKLRFTKMHGLGNDFVVFDAITQRVQLTLGPLLEHHPRFPRRVNVGFMEVASRDQIRLWVFERGVGETLACGSGAGAAVVIGQLQGLLAATVQVDLPGGSLRIHWPDESAGVTMTGPATRVFEGWIEP